MNDIIYFDYAATTPVDPQVLKNMEPYFTLKFGNPSSIHCLGQQSRLGIEEARQKAAQFLGAKSSEIIFTSCATESNNLALKGLVEALSNKVDRPHLIISPIEHHCVLDTAKHLEKQGVEVTWLSVNKDSLVDLQEIEKSIKDNTILVSVMYGNNEVGTVEPIAEIGRLLKKINLLRVTDHLSPVYFHTDAVQAFQYLDCNVDQLGVDLLSLTAHKFYGPKGTGLLYVRTGTPLTRQQDGGGQERNLRAGTENTAGIIGMAAAMETAVQNREQAIKKINGLRTKLIDGVLKNVKDSVLTGSPTQRLPHIASFSMAGVEGESILLLLNEQGVAASSGSACTSGLLKPSHVLTAMGYTPQEAHGSIRFSLGKDTTEEQIEKVVEILPAIVEKLRTIAPDLTIGD